MSQPDRRALDDVVFDVFGLTAWDRQAVYEAVVALVRLPARCAPAGVRPPSLKLRRTSPCLRRERDRQVEKSQSV